MEPSCVLTRSKLLSQKRQITLFCAVNSLGTEKMKLSFIRNHNQWKPKLPVYYYWNRTAWMQVSFFNEILIILNNNMKKQGRKILDNALLYIICWKAKVELLPPNTTTFLQSCDAGIIHSFNCKCKVSSIQNWIKTYDGL